MRRVLLDVTLVGFTLVAFAGCPSARDRVNEATTASFACDPSKGPEGQCPEGAVCGLEGTCHAKVSGEWACDPTANAGDGTNPACFGEPLDVCGADARCHSESAVDQAWACTSDVQCRNGRRCSEASGTCVETANEALVPSALPTTLPDAVRLRSFLQGRGDNLAVSATTPARVCTAGDLGDGVLLRRARTEDACPSVDYLDNRLQTFAWFDVEEASSIEVAIIAQQPIGGTARELHSGVGVLSYVVPLAPPPSGADASFQRVLGGKVMVVNANAWDVGADAMDVYPLVSWFDSDLRLHWRHVKENAVSGSLPDVALGITAASAQTGIFGGFSGTGGAPTARFLAELFVWDAEDLFRIRFPQDAALPTVTYWSTPDPDSTYVPLPTRDGVLALGNTPRFRLDDSATGEWETLPVSTALEAPFGDGLHAGTVTSRVHTAEGLHGGLQTAVTFERDAEAGAQRFLVAPNYLGGESERPGVSFPVACEPCSRNEQAQVVGWVPDARGALEFVVRCGAGTAQRSVAVTVHANTIQAKYSCRLDVRTDALGRDERAFAPVDHAGALAFRDGHNVIGVLPTQGGEGAYVVASGIDRAPAGLTRINGRATAFSGPMVWARRSAVDAGGATDGSFEYAPFANVELLGTVHAPVGFPLNLVVAAIDGEARILDATHASTDLLPTAAMFESPPPVTRARHHGMIIESPATFAVGGAARAFSLFVTVGDSLLGADVGSLLSGTSGGAVPQLSVRLTPQPGSPIRSLTFAEPVDDAGAPVFARGYALTDNGLFGFEAMSPSRFRSYELPSRETGWVGLFTDGAQLSEGGARARLAYRDGVIVSLPSQLPLSKPLPTIEGAPPGSDALIGVLAHCGHVYGLSTQSLFHLTSTPGQVLGEWTNVLDNADAEARPFTGGALLRDGDTLYLFSGTGHVRTWEAPACGG